MILSRTSTSMMKGNVGSPYDHSKNSAESESVVIADRREG